LRLFLAEADRSKFEKEMRKIIVLMAVSVVPN